MRNILLSLFSLTVLFTACNNERLTLQEEIQSLEKKAMADSSNFNFNPKVQAELGDKMIAYADKFPEDKKSEEYLFKAAAMYIGMGQSEKAINTLEKYIKLYPGGKFRARATFNIGYVYDTQVHNKEKAIKAYEEYVREFPKDSLVKDTQMMLLYLKSNVSDEALADSFLKKASADSAAESAGKEANKKAAR